MIHYHAASHLMNAPVRHCFCCCCDWAWRLLTWINDRWAVGGHDFLCVAFHGITRGIGTGTLKKPARWRKA